ncbi:ORF V: Enzymatic polyprotein [Labeo rohita]|uniref:ORF V: Enzymatic polyprotein n=1 Tax=Labeo rohita TaxID=84645 RepID=A0ABQ8N2M0_LABRO|nr:ORF V: Enzymatic polyprotein [Labeo rohita]
MFCRVLTESLPMECPDDFGSSQYGLDLLFGAPAGEKEDAAASEGEPEPSQLPGCRNGRRTSAGSREIGVTWAPPPGPEPLRLDDWFLGKGRDPWPRSSPVPFFPEVHEELMRSWKAPLSARSRYANSSSLTTLDGGPARGYTEVPQVERAIAMHLCPQNAASWRGQPKLPSRACKFSSTLVAKAYSASGQAASALHAMAILQVYQAKVLKDLHEGVPDPELVQELDGDRRRPSSTSCLGVWRAPAQLRRGSNPRLLRAEGGRLREQLRTRDLLVLQLHPPPGPALVGRWHRQLVLRPLRTLARLRSGPETGRPGRRDRLTCPDPHSTRGRALDSASNRLSAPGQTATTWSIKEQFLPSLGVTHSTSDPLHHRVLCPPSRTCGHTPTVFPHVLKHRACSDDFPPRGNPLVSFHGTNLLGVAASGSRGFLSPATHCPPSHTTPIPGASGVTPLRPLAENISGWLNIPNLSRWLLRTIRLGYAIQFARRPPKFRGVLATSVRGSSATVLCAEIAVLLAKGAIETFPSAEMRKGFYSPYFIVPKKGGQMQVYGPPKTGSEASRAHGMSRFFKTQVSCWVCHMRPLQHWLHTRVPRWAWRRGTLRVGIKPSCRKTLSPWTDLAFLWSGVPLEQVSRRIVVTTDASKTGWGAVCNGQAASGVWTGPRLLWHINCLELLAVLLALKRFRSLVQGKHVLVRSDNTATSLHQPPGRCTLLSHVTTRPPSLVMEPTQTQVSSGHSHSGRSQPCGRFSVTPSFARRRVEAPPPGGPADLGSIRPGTSRSLCLTGIHPLPVVVRAIRGSPRDRRTGTQLAKEPAQVCVSSSEPHRTDPVQSQGGQGTDSLGGSFLAPQNLVLRPGAPGISPSLAHSPEEGPPLSGEGHNLAPPPRSLEPPSMVPGRDQEDFRDLSPSVVNTLLQARAPSTRWLYDLKWCIFVNWCSSRGEDPRRCGVEGGLDRHLSASTRGRSVGKHDLIIRFLKGARRLNPPRPHLIPSWDLAVVLQGLQRDPFEPLQSVEVDALSLKTVLLTALTSVKRVGDLQALSVNNACLEFGPADSHVVLRPRPGYVPKVPTTPFRDQVVTLQAISSQEDDPNLTLLCPVRALRIYLERTQPFRRSEQLFVCYGGQQKGKAVSKQRISHWLVDAIRMAYEARGLPCPLGIRAHSTRGVAASAALANGASLTDICRAAVAPQVAPCVYFPPIAHYGAVFPLRSGCDLRSASFPRETVTSPTSAKTLSRSTETGPAAGHCCNRSVLGRWKVTKSVRQIGNVSVTYGNPRSLMEGTETLCLPCHNSGPSLSELRRSAPHIRTSEQMHMLPYLYPDERGVASYANLHTQFSLACFYTVRGVWAPKSDP